MTLYFLLAVPAGLLAGWALATALVLYRRVAALHRDWRLVDDLTGETVDPRDDRGGHMDVPLGDTTVRLRYTGTLRLGWQELDDARRQRLLRSQQAWAWTAAGGLVMGLWVTLAAGVPAVGAAAAAAAWGAYALAGRLGKEGDGHD